MNGPFTLSALSAYLTLLRPIAETLYFLSAVVVAIAALIGLKQIRLLKNDIRSRNKRAAREKAIDACHHFSSEIVPQHTLIFTAYTKAGLKMYEGPVGEFSIESVSMEYKIKLVAKTKLPDLSLSAFLSVMNALEGFAMTVTSGVAEDETAFNAVGSSYCSIVTQLYDVFSVARNKKDLCNDHTDTYYAVVELYGLWSARLKKSQLALQQGVLLDQMDSLERRISEIAEHRIPPIGPEV